MKRGGAAARPRSWFRVPGWLAGPSDVEHPGTMDRRTLRFRDPALEVAFRRDYFANNLANLRLVHVFAIVMWIAWGLYIQGQLPFAERGLDLVVRYAIFIPILVVGLALSFAPRYPSFWEWEVGGTVLLTMVVWVVYVAQIIVMPLDYGYVGLILITAVTYTIVRLRFVIVAVLTAVAIASYVPLALLVLSRVGGLRAMLAIFYLLSFGLLGCLVAYRQERFTRLLFLRERQLDRERRRSDGLLLNIFPKVIADRLKSRIDDRGSRPLAETLDDVTVLFADAVGFTRQTTMTSAGELVETLDRLFSRFDELADRYGLEKIKTVGDAYMAAAGAPVPIPDHADAAAGMALSILEEVDERWPSGDPIEVRIGIASGPVVAGVIGRRKFAYDLWGDTVNLASRLESGGRPGRILVSEGAADRLGERFAFGPPEVVDLKGKGPTQVRFLLGRTADIPAADPAV